MTVRLGTSLGFQLLEPAFFISFATGPLILPGSLLMIHWVSDQSPKKPYIYLTTTLSLPFLTISILPSLLQNNGQPDSPHLLQNNPMPTF